MESPLLVVQNVQCAHSEGDVIFSGANFVVDEGDVVVVRARSGAGKTTLLKCLAHLNLYQGTLSLNVTFLQGVPVYRTLVQYIPQRPSLLPGTPRDLLHSVASMHSRAGRTHDLQAVLDIASSWDVDESLWDRAWNCLSGGEAQRLALAIGFGLNTAEILLLDEPTSALDADISQVVEDTLVHAIKSSESNLKAIPPSCRLHIIVRAPEPSFHTPRS
ncbi:P-loop containing nucleoside triphosphate hydrolase protein [Amylostereum chailletii]|nr:P-loop containing nucleoside triphosphate hydrolase protein [Amylostereum chailletii]